MKRIKSLFNYFSKLELCLWFFSLFMIVFSFIVFDKENYTTLFSSLIGATSLIYCAKGNPIGQVLMIVFSLFYGIISYTFSYYGEMITYMCMTAPMAIVSLVSWLKHPFEENKSEVRINCIKITEIIFMLILSAFITLIFYFLLSFLGTASIVLSTLSVTTSFIAVYLTFRRSPYFALAYALNDIILIVLWILAAIHDISYLCVIICFFTFLITDIYSFFNWKRLLKKQSDYNK